MAVQHRGPHGSELLDRLAGGPTSGTAVVVLVAVVDAAFFPVTVAVTVGGGRGGTR